MENIRSKIILLILAVGLIGLLFGFLPTQAQTLTIDSIWVSKEEINPVTEGELLYALELADYYLTDKINTYAIYIDEPERLRMQADYIEKKRSDLIYIKSIQVRLALYGIAKGKNSK